MDDGAAKKVTAQVCAVDKMVMSVSKVTSKGDWVIFDDEGSFIENKAAEARTWLTASSTSCPRTSSTQSD